MWVAGCANEAPPVASGAAEESFKAWMAKYDPAAEAKESGIYLRFVERGAVPITPQADKSWIRANYTLYSLNGVVGETRSDTVAKVIDSWSPITHFIDDLLPYYSKVYADYPKICEGLRSAFQYLRPGDSVRIYIPAHLGYLSGSSPKGMNVNSAYGGETLGYLDRPCYFDMRVSEVINDMSAWEQRAVESYVHSWGIPGSDSVVRGVYMRVLEDDPKGAQITKDSTIRYYYAARFLDHHLIRSNVLKVIEKAKYFYYASPADDWDLGEVTYAPADFDGTSTPTDSTYRALLSKVLLKAKTGQTIEVVATSRLIPLGTSGDASGTPQVLPYEPRRLQLKVLRWDQKAEQGLYDWKWLY